MTFIQPCGPKAYSDIDLRQAARILRENKPRDDWWLASENLHRAARHSDITADERLIITAVETIIDGIESFDDTVGPALATILTRTAHTIGERERDYGYGLPRSVAS